MNTYETNLMALLKFSENIDATFIDLTKVLVTAPHINEQTKLEILYRLVNDYEILRKEQ